MKAVFKHALISSIVLVAMLWSTPSFSNEIPGKSLRVKSRGSQADLTLTCDGDTSSGWSPGAGSFSVTYDFSADTYLEKIRIHTSKEASVTLETNASVCSDIRLKAGSNEIELPLVLASKMTLILKAVGLDFRLNEVTFFEGAPETNIRPNLKASASTTLENKIKRYGPHLAIDGKLSTAWNEGAKEARGQWLAIDFDRPAFVHHAGVIVGYSKYNQKVGEVWFKNHRIKKARLDYGNGWYFDAEFEDKLDYQYVPIKMKIDTTRITIKDLYPTAKWEDTPISEVKFIYEYVDDIKLEMAFDQEAVLRTDSDLIYLVLRVKGAYTHEMERPPANAVLVIDESGSMRENNRIHHARESAKLIISSLGPTDYLSLITFDDVIRERFPPTLMDTQAKSELVRIIDGLEPLDMTNIYKAMDRAVALAAKNTKDSYSSRILLLSDGKPTAGNKNTGDIARISEQGFADSKIVTSSFGIGPDYNEDLMSAIALNAAGSYYHISNPTQMFKAFVAEMSNTLNVLGKDVHVAVDVPGHMEIKNVYGHRWKMEGGKIRINLNSISTAEEQKIVIALQPKKRLPVESEFFAQLRYTIPSENNRRVSQKTSRILTGTENSQLARASMNPIVRAEVLATLGAEGLEKAIRKYESGNTVSAADQLKKHIDHLKKENKYLKSEALTKEIAILSNILNTMQNASAGSSQGRLAIKTAKAEAINAKKKSYAGSSLVQQSKSPEDELKYLLSTNFQNPGIQYGSTKPEAIIGILVSRGLAQKEAAKAANTMGFRLYRKKNYSEALAWFDSAINYDNRHALAVYNAACMSGLLKDPEMAVKYLQQLVRIDDQIARSRLKKAQTDTDFNLIRQDKVFTEFMKSL